MVKDLCVFHHGRNLRSSSTFLKLMNQCDFTNQLLAFKSIRWDKAFGLIIVKNQEDK